MAHTSAWQAAGTPAAPFPAAFPGIPLLIGGRQSLKRPELNPYAGAPVNQVFAEVVGRYCGGVERPSIKDGPTAFEDSRRRRDPDPLQSLVLRYGERDIGAVSPQGCRTIRVDGDQFRIRGKDDYGDVQVSHGVAQASEAAGHAGQDQEENIHVLLMNGPDDFFRILIIDLY